GSTGWVVCQSNGCSTTSAYLHPKIAQEIFGTPDGIVAWGPPGSPYEATPVDGGYRITGKWRFMSGSQNATWLGAHLRVAGTKDTKTFLYPKSSATFHDIWHTLGLPREKTRRGAGKPMAENNVVQSHVAQSEARWRSARYFLHAAADEALETIEERGEMELDQRTRLRLASTWAIQSSREIVNTLFHDCGSMSVCEENPFERRLRDIDTVAQQGQGRILHYETVGQVMLGVSPENIF